MAPMKFSLSKGGPAARKPPLPPKPGSQEDELKDEVEYLTSVDQNGIPQGKGSGIKIIPKLENSWRPEKRMKRFLPMELDEQSAEERFETVTLPTGPVEGEQYGLSLRKKDFRAENGEASVSRVSLQDLEEQRFRQQVEELPDEVSMDVYESMPVEDFAHAMLRGMGWERGKPIGRNAKVVVEPIEYVRRYGTTGLGATPLTLKEERKKIIKPGESREKPVQRTKDGISNGKVMAIVAGKHSGLRGEVVLKKGGEESSDKYNMRLLICGEYVEVLTSEVAEIGSFKEDQARRKLKELQIGSIKKDASGLDGDKLSRKSKDQRRDDKKEAKFEKTSRKDRDKGSDLHVRIHLEERQREVQTKRSNKIENGSSGSKSKGEGSTVNRSWLMSNIKVKVVSKSFKGGKLYLKKARIVDVASPTICDILMDDTGEVHQEVKQEYLETALPKTGGRVMVIGGRYYGLLGKLIERNFGAEFGVVQLEDTFEIINLNLDFVAEFIGD